MLTLYSKTKSRVKTLKTKAVLLNCNTAAKPKLSDKQDCCLVEGKPPAYAYLVTLNLLLLQP